MQGRRSDVPGDGPSSGDAARRGAARRARTSCDTDTADEWPSARTSGSLHRNWIEMTFLMSAMAQTSDWSATASLDPDSGPPN